MGKSTYNPRRHWVFGNPTCQKLALWWGRREMGAWWGHVMTIIDGPHFLCIGGKSGGVEPRSCGMPFSGQQKTGVSASFCASSWQRPCYCWSPVCFEIRMKENQASFACFRPHHLPRQIDRLTRQSAPELRHHQGSSPRYLPRSVVVPSSTSPWLAIYFDGIEWRR